jgi:magnesium-transporting ATPase (P-type)
MATNEDAASAAEPERAPEKKTESPASDEATAASPLQGLRATASAARRLFGNWRSLFILLLLYAALIASLYFFIAVREASIWQVLATFLLAIIAPVLFFIIQTIGVRYAEDDVRARDLLRWSVRDFWKLFVVTVPLLLLAWLIAYLFGKFHVANTVAVVTEAARAGAGAAAGARPPARAAEAFSWKEVILTTLRFLILGLVLPLLTIHLWIAVARRGLGGAFRTIKSVLAAALAPGAVLIYAIGLLLFGLVPYFLITANYSRGGAWTEIGLLAGRLLVASLFMLFGWIITLGALSIISPEPKARMKDEG